MFYSVLQNDTCSLTITKATKEAHAKGLAYIKIAQQETTAKAQQEPASNRTITCGFLISNFHSIIIMYLMYLIMLPENAYFLYFGFLKMSTVPGSLLQPPNTIAKIPLQTRAFRVFQPV